MIESKNDFEAVCFCRKLDLENFFSNIPHVKILQAWMYLWDAWKCVHGNRRNNVCVPKTKVPFDLSMVQTQIRQIGLRCRKEALDLRNHTIRAQALRKCAFSHYCIHLTDMEYVLSFDLKYGYMRLGTSLCISQNVGIPQGSPLSPGIAEMVLATTEAKNKNVFISDGLRWLHCFAKLVDDGFFGLVAFIKKCLSPSPRARVKGACKVWADERFCAITGAYFQTGLGVKEEDESVFIGMHVAFDGIWKCGMKFPQPHENKYRLACSFAPMSLKIGVVIGQIYAALVRDSTSYIVPEISLFLSCMKNAGYSHKIIDCAVRSICQKLPWLHEQLEQCVACGFV